MQAEDNRKAIWAYQPSRMISIIRGRDLYTRKIVSPNAQHKRDSPRARRPRDREPVKNLELHMRTHRGKRPKPKRLSAHATETGNGDNKIDKLESRNWNQNARQPDETRNHYSNSSRYRDAAPNSTRHIWVETPHKRERDKTLAALQTLRIGS